MRFLRNRGVLAALTLLAAWPATSQIVSAMPNVRGVWNPALQTITLDRVIGNATGHIMGTPQKFDPDLPMRQRGGQQPPRQ